MMVLVVVGSVVVGFEWCVEKWVGVVVKETAK